jgi:hypothetical protein
MLYTRHFRNLTSCIKLNNVTLIVIKRDSEYFAETLFCPE